MKKKKIIIREDIGWIDYIIALTLAILFIYGILQKSGTITSGYHLADDHELIRMEFGFKNGSALGQSIIGWVVGDFHWRYRPLYWVERVLGSFFLGSELLYWNYYTAIKGILSFVLLYFTARYFRYGRMVSALLPCVVMLGAQFTPWYRSANQENTGLLLVAFVLCMISVQAFHQKYTAGYYNALIIIGAVLCGLVKESFTLFMPVFIAVKFWLEYWEDGKEIRKGDFLRCLKNNAVTYGIIILAMLVNIGMILFRVGVDKVSYAGFSKDTPLWVYKQGVKASLFVYMKQYTYAGILIFFLAVVCYRAIEKKDIKKYICLGMISVCAMGIQLIAHAKSGMWERYMIPYMVAYAVAFVLLAYRFFEKDRIQKLVFYAILFWLVGGGIKTAYENSVSYAEDGRNTNQFLNELYARTAEDDDILCAFEAEEFNWAIECWLEVHDRIKAYSWINGDFRDIIQLTGSAPEQYLLENVDALVCCEWQAETLFPLIGIESEEDCSMYQFGDYLIVLKGFDFK